MTTIPYLTDNFLDTVTVTHGFFTRHGGVSSGVYDSLNCGLGSNDDVALCHQNRRLAASAIGGETDSICGLFQIHSDICHIANPKAKMRPEGDAIVTDKPDITLAILTADCVPILFADSDAGVIGAAHAGWRGAVQGVISSTVDQMKHIGAKPEKLRAVIGPAIQQASYQVGPDLRDEVLSYYPDASSQFICDVEDKWKFDLPGFVAGRLSELGISYTSIYADTYSDDRFFSHRKNTHQNGPDTGRLVSMIRLNS